MMYNIFMSFSITISYAERAITCYLILDIILKQIKRPKNDSIPIQSFRINLGGWWGESAEGTTIKNINIIAQIDRVFKHP